MKFSVCIPTRNRVELVIGLVESLQDCRWNENLEIIIADNTNKFIDCADKLNYLSQKYPNVKILHDGTPMSPWDNWQRAAAAATGDWVIMMPDKCRVAHILFSHLKGLILKECPEVITWKVLYGEKFTDYVSNNYFSLSVAESINNLLLFDFYKNDLFPHGMNCAYKRFDGHEKMYVPFCADYNQGMDLVIKQQKIVYHLDSYLTRISRNISLEYSTGASISAGANNVVANYYMKWLPSYVLSDIEQASIIKDTSFPGNYIYYDLCKSLAYNPFPTIHFDTSNYYASYYRHLFEKLVFHKKLVKPQIFDRKGLFKFVYRLARDLKNRI